MFFIVFYFLSVSLYLFQALNGQVMHEIITPEVNAKLIISSDIDFSVSYTQIQDTGIVEYDNKTASAISILEDIKIPVSIIRKESSLRAIVFFLKSSGYSFKQISSLLNRDQRTVWCTYHASQYLRSVSHNPVDSVSANFVPNLDSVEYYVPVSIFHARTLSVLESVVLYLKTAYSLSFKGIALLLNRNYQTVHTVYMRAIKKLST